MTPPARGAYLLDLARASWAEMSLEDRAMFGAWLEEAKPEDLYLLLRHAINTRPPRKGSSPTLEAVRATEIGAEGGDDGGGNES